MFDRWFPESASLVADEIDKLFWWSTGWTGGAGLIFVVIFVSFLIIYRQRVGRLPFYTHGNSRGALLLTLSLALLVFLALDLNLAYQDHKVWQKMFAEPPNSADAVRVEIMPEQFAWNVRYAGADSLFGTDDDIITMNELHVPVNRSVIVQLTSKDVIHSFFLPNLRIKQDAIPGMVTSIYFYPNQVGQFNMACAQHCGLGHYRMKGAFVIEEEDAFNAWLGTQEKQADNPSLWAWDWNTRLAVQWKPGPKKES